MKLTSFLAVSAVAISSFSLASADTILATDFAGGTASGDTMSNITWTTNGVSDPGDLTVSEFDAGTNDAVLFSQAADYEIFAVDLNIANEGSWSVAIPLVISGNGLELDALSLDAFTFNNGGDFQDVVRDFDLTVSILDASDNSEIFSELFGNVQDTNSNVAGPFAISADLTGLTLEAGATYTLLLSASSDESRGNNAGFDNFSLTGTAVAAVPVPAAGLLMLGGLVSLTAVRRRKS